MITVNNMKYDFATNSALATQAYNQAEQVIRLVEANGSWNMEQADYGDIDWVMVGLAMGMLCDNRRLHFLTVLEEMTAEGKCEQEVAYKLVCTNFFYENYTMYMLECFRQLFVKKNRAAKVLTQTFVEFIKNCRTETEGKRSFTFLRHTPSPLCVQ